MVGVFSFFAGKSLRVSEKKFRTWEILLAELAQHVSMTIDTMHPFHLNTRTA